MKLSNLLRLKIFIFCVQFLMLALFIYYFNYNVKIQFDAETTEIQRQIIQFLANFILLLNSSNILFLYSFWLLISLIPIFIHLEPKKATTMNFLTYFIIAFFSNLFLSRYASVFYYARLTSILVNLLILGFTIIIFSFVFSMCLKFIKKFILQQVKKSTDFNECVKVIKCPYCGVEFNSIPLYCYNCNSKIGILENNFHDNIKLEKK